MKPLAALPDDVAGKVEGLLFDLDDTFLDHGALHEATYRALFRLREAGISAVGLTGRPSNWAEVAARLFPLAGCVAENGALGWYVTPAANGRTRLQRWDPVPPELRRERVAKLDEIVREMTRVFPALAVADDGHGRVSDRAWDVGEFSMVSPEMIAEVTNFLEDRGAKVRTSSVHLHATFDGHDKATGAAAFLSERLGVDPGVVPLRWAFVGDSGNDTPCFNVFRVGVGVANLHQARLAILPRYLTKAPRGAGFVELVDRLVAARTPAC